MVRLRDIAERAGTSVGTVSVVLNGRSSKVRISERTRQAILDASHALGYSPNLAARRLRTTGDARRSLVLAMAHPVDSRLSLIARAINGIQRQLADLEQAGELDFEVQLTIETFGLGELHRLRGLDEPLWYNGLLVTNTSPADDTFIERHAGVPIVLFQRYSRKSYVNADNRQAAADVAAHLLALGHHRLAVITPGNSSQAHLLRIAGFSERVTAAGVAAPRQVHGAGTSWMVDAYDAAKRIFAGPASQRPTAIFATNDLLALGVIRAAADHHIRVPDDLAVVGCDDAEFARFNVPSLTTIHLPVEEMAARATAILLDLIQSKAQEPVQELFPTRLVIRDSCGASLSLDGSGRMRSLAP